MGMLRWGGGDVRKDSDGRYGCGCKVEMTRSGGGVMRLLPICANHGDGFALRTVLGHRAVAIARSALIVFGLIG